MGAQTLDDFFIGEAGTLGWLLRAAETDVLQSHYQFLLGHEVDACETKVAGDGLIVGVLNGGFCFQPCHETAEMVARPPSAPSDESNPSPMLHIIAQTITNSSMKIKQ